MPTALKLHLLLLLTLPALLVPRGLELGWCLCSVAERVGCCAPADEVTGRSGACCAEEAEHGPEDRAKPCGDSRAALDCPGCRSIELEDFEEFLVTKPAPELPAPAPAPVVAGPRGIVAEAAGALFAPLRAPPGVVPRPGLLPGTAPLRI